MVFKRLCQASNDILKLRMIIIIHYVINVHTRDNKLVRATRRDNEFPEDSYDIRINLLIREGWIICARRNLFQSTFCLVKESRRKRPRDLPSGNRVIIRRMQNEQDLWIRTWFASRTTVRKRWRRLSTLTNRSVFLVSLLYNLSYSHFHFHPRYYS